MKKIGYVGIFEGRPYWETTTDGYVDLGEEGIPVADVYKSHKEARKRFQVIAPVYVGTVEMPRGQRRRA